jgi:hypothetical protein
MFKHTKMARLLISNTPKQQNSQNPAKKCTFVMNAECFDFFTSPAKSAGVI